MEAVEALSAGKHVSEEDLVLLGQLPDPTQGHGHLFTLIRTFLLPMKSNPVVTLLTVQESQQQKASLEQLFERAETEDSAEVCRVRMNSERVYSEYRMLFRVLPTVYPQWVFNPSPSHMHTHAKHTHTHTSLQPGCSVVCCLLRSSPPSTN